MSNRTTSVLKPMSVNPTLHYQTKLIATLERKEINEVADELYLPIAQKKVRALTGKNEGGKR